MKEGCWKRGVGRGVWVNESNGTPPVDDEVGHDEHEKRKLVSLATKTQLGQIICQSVSE